MTSVLKCRAVLHIMARVQCPFRISVRVSTVLWLNFCSSLVFLSSSTVGHTSFLIWPQGMLNHLRLDKFYADFSKKYYFRGSYLPSNVSSSDILYHLLFFSLFEPDLGNRVLQSILLQRYTLRTRFPYNAKLELRQPSYNVILLQRDFRSTTSQKLLPNSLLE